MSMKSSLNTLLALSAIGLLPTQNFRGNRPTYEAMPSGWKNPNPHNLQEWNVNGKIVYASSKKMAIKKASKL